MTVRETRARALGPGLVAVALLSAVIGSVGAPLITSVATGFGVSLAAAQWTLTVTLFSGAITAPLLGRLGAGQHRRPTMLATLALVALGGAVAALPLPFAALLIGRGLQGLGLGVAPLLMSVARDRLSEQRATSVIATISVASTVGIGVGYPLIGLLDQLAGLRAAYGLGLALSLAALWIAWRVIPSDPPGASVRIDVAGAILLAVGIFGVLLVIAQPEVWRLPIAGAGVLVLAGIALTGWMAVERRVPSPLVDPRQLTVPNVLRANVAMLLAGAGMYLLFSLLTRFLQTPAGAGYGFALPGLAAGAALIPFSVLGFVAGRLAPRILARASAEWAYIGAVVAVAVSAGVFALGRDSLLAVLAAMAVLGAGVGGVSALMPQLVLTGVQRAETASVLSINQIVRSIGFSMGSALAGLLLASSTPSGALLPDRDGYALAALWAGPLLLASIVPVLTLRGHRAR